MNIIKEFFFPENTQKYLDAGKAKTAVFYSEAVVTGEYELYDIYAIDTDKKSLLRIAASLSKGTDFAFAKAIENAALKMGISQGAVRTKKSRDGVAGETYGREYFLGNKRFIKENGVEVPYGILHADFSGYTVIYIACDNELLGLFLFYEELSCEAVRAIHFFRDNGIKTVLLGQGKKLELLKKRTEADEIRSAILHLKREKVLQELKKNDKIIVIKAPTDVRECVCRFFFGSRLLKLKRTSVIATGVLIALSLFFITLPMLSMLFAMNTFAFMLYSSMTLRRITPDMPDITEEEIMFCKAKYTMNISGMSCAHCSARVKSTLESFRGVSAEISLEEKVARIKCPASLDIETLSKAVSDAGYTVNSVERV